MARSYGGQAVQEQQASPSVNGYSRTGEGDLTAGQPTGIPSESGGRVRGRRWIIFAGIDLLVPFAVFAARVGTWTLNPFAAPRMLRYDWVTYISAPNFLRSAPLLTFPLGRTPDYMAPVGSSLGLADASPFMLPLYRLLNVISPDHPTQILGLLVLASYVLTYYWSVKFLRRAYVALRGQAPSLLVDVEIRVAGVLLLLLPVFTSRISHVALTQQWILVAALYCAVFCRQVSDATTDTSSRCAWGPPFCIRTSWSPSSRSRLHTSFGGFATSGAAAWCSAVSSLAESSASVSCWATWQSAPARRTPATATTPPTWRSS